LFPALGTRTIPLGGTTLNDLGDRKRRIEHEAQACGKWHENHLVSPSTVGAPFANTDLQRDFARGGAAADLRRIPFHDLRHTAANLMLIRGIPALVVSKILGHANAGIILSIYAQSTLDLQTWAASFMDEIVTPIAVGLPQLQPIATNRNRG